MLKIDLNYVELLFYFFNFEIISVINFLSKKIRNTKAIKKYT